MLDALAFAATFDELQAPLLAAARTLAAREADDGARAGAVGVLRALADKGPVTLAAVELLPGES